MKKEYDLAKWLAGEMNEAELRDFQQSAEFTIYQKIKNHTEGLETPTFDADAMYQNIISHQKKKPVLQLRGLTAAAAILVVAMGLLFLAKPYFGTTEIVAVAETQAFTLPDNSEVVLNTRSEIEYKKSNWDNNRKLELSGEAYFKVAKGSTFDVKTKLGTVTVVGTQFNVKAQNKQLDVECYEGKVKVSFNGEELFLTEGQTVSVVDGKAISSATPDNQPAWTTNEIRFYNQSLKSVLMELEQQYNIKIDGKAIDVDQHYTGKLPQNNLDTALHIISKTYRFNYKKLSDKEIILTPHVETP